VRPGDAHEVPRCRIIAGISAQQQFFMFIFGGKKHILGIIRIVAFGAIAIAGDCWFRSDIEVSERVQ
jgi:hypothetical protein